MPADATQGMAFMVENAYDAAVSSDPYVHRSAVSMSMIGRCRRQAAYAIRDGWPDTPGAGSPQAYLGAAIHQVLLPDLSSRLGGVTEQRVELEVGGLTLTGSADLVLDGDVVDVKTTSQWYYDVVTTRTPRGHRLQVTGYALATGRTGCTVLYVNRSDGERHAVSWNVEEYMTDLADWVAEVQIAPEDLPRDERGPGLSMICDSCPFAEKCWGTPVPPKLPQSVLITEHGIEMALEEYDAARATAKQGKEDQEFWRAVLEAYEPGPYGGWQLTWSNPRESETKDVAAMEAKLTELGLPIPMRTKPAGKPSIGVKRAKNPPKSPIT